MFTDPARIPDVAAAARRLPSGSGVVYRAFNAADAVEIGRSLRRICNEHDLTLLVGADVRLAAIIVADGLHLPERLRAALPRIRASRPLWRVTVAAHSLRAARAGAALGADAVVVSPVFMSRSPSAGRPLGPLRLSVIVRRVPAPVYALGGVDAATVKKLDGTGVAGCAAVEALA